MRMVFWFVVVSVYIANIQSSPAYFVDHQYEDEVKEKRLNYLFNC